MGVFDWKRQYVAAAAREVWWIGDHVLRHLAGAIGARLSRGERLQVLWTYLLLGGLIVGRFRLLKRTTG